MELRPSSRALVRLALGLLAIALLAGGWELLATQSPHSPYHAGVLPEPVAQLRRTALAYAFGSFALAWLLPWLSPDREPWLVLSLLIVGAALSLGAIGWGAIEGRMVVQLSDPNQHAQRLVWMRVTGQGVLGLAFLELLRRSFRRPRRTPSSA